MKWRYLTILMMLLGGFTLLGSTQQRVEAATYWMDPVKLPDGSTTLYTNAPPELSPGVPGYIPFADSQTDPNNAMFTSLGNAIRITSSSNTTKPTSG
ncbi:hypothetical protein [Lacticaseibacillus saniviri]|uniref:hypothetical protein n=1 Tax=Lacticaseibacillus saniviri TaxID=931533 RepID=UPI0006D2623A|nr:hypothetical protein [Lacticaseibacillus saniviri]